MGPDDDRPKNREVENEMICPPPHEGMPPRPATEPAHSSLAADQDREDCAYEPEGRYGADRGEGMQEKKTVIFSFVFLNRASAQAFAVSIENDDVHAQVEDLKDGATPCAVHASIPLTADAEQISVAQTKLQAIAELHEGRTDGCFVREFHQRRSDRS